MYSGQQLVGSGHGLVYRFAGRDLGRMAATTLVLVHGAWHQRSAWDLVTPQLEQRGHAVVTPSLSVAPSTRLADHVVQLSEAIAAAAANGPVTVVAHSYAGVPAAQAVTRMRPAVERLVLLDAWLAPAGRSKLDIAPEWYSGWCLDSAAGDPAMLPIPPLWSIGIPDGSFEAEWLSPRLVEHPLATFTDPVETQLDTDGVTMHAIVCTPAMMPFREFAMGAGCQVYEIESGHDVMVTRPVDLAALLHAVSSPA